MQICLNCGEYPLERLNSLIRDGGFHLTLAVKVPLKNAIIIPLVYFFREQKYLVGKFFYIWIDKIAPPIKKTHFLIRYK